MQTGSVASSISEMSGASLRGEVPSAIVLGCSDESLSPFEREFFAAANPVGFILFRRNCSSPQQVRELVISLRECVGRDDAPILIDQEGGRVARLRPPHWRDYPSAARLASLPDPVSESAVRLAARLIAEDLARLGITVDCFPVLDLVVCGADPVIGDRAYGSNPERVARLARAACDGLLEGAVLPVIKHIPGHGRAGVDSHHACPLVEAPYVELAQTDFAPFRALAGMPWAMTAHIVYAAIDPALPATLSPRVVAEVIRGEIAFDGVLISDDVSMRALGGGIGERTRQALAAGCDLVLHCNGNPSEMEEAAAAAIPISPRTAERLARGEAIRRRLATNGFDREEADVQFGALLAAARTSEIMER
jgi:beta-N-acetylhexosaminidase